MIEEGSTYVVMGVLDSDSIAYYVGKMIQDLGGNVIYTAQNDRMKKIFFDRSKKLSDEEKAAIDFKYCDVTVEEEVKALFDDCGEISGVVHSIAYANPKTSLGREFHTDEVEDLKMAFHISAASLATVTRYASEHMKDGGSVVGMTFDTRRVYPLYNWMGVCKSALESVARALARRHGPDLVRVNVVSAGPLITKAATKIPGFSELGHIWNTSSPLPWDTEHSKVDVAHTVAYLLGPYSKMITGETIHVDGGATLMGGTMQPWELDRSLVDDEEA